MVSGWTIDQSLWVGLRIPRFEDPEDVEGRWKVHSKAFCLKARHILATIVCLQSVGYMVDSILERRQDNPGLEKEVVVVQHQVIAGEDQHTCIVVN